MTTEQVLLIIGSQLVGSAIGIAISIALFNFINKRK